MNESEDRDVRRFREYEKKATPELRRKQLEAYRAKYPVKFSESWHEPPFFLRSGEWTVWRVSNKGNWFAFKDGLHIITADRYASYLNANQPSEEVGKWSYAARVNAPRGGSSR